MNNANEQKVAKKFFSCFNTYERKFKMEVKAVSFMAKMPKTPKIDKMQPEYRKALQDLLGQSDKDYLSLQKGNKAKTESKPDDFVKNAKKFFSNIF